MSKDESIEGIDFPRGEYLIGGWTFLNIDGVVQARSGSAAVGGVLRDENGDWILRYNKFLVNYLIFYAKL